MITAAIILFLIYLYMSPRPPWPWKRRYPGTPLTPEQRRQTYESMRSFLEGTTHKQIHDMFPEYMRDIELSRKYKDLERRHRAGEISEVDYQIELDQLSQEVPVNIEPAPAPRRRFFWMKK